VTVTPREIREARAYLQNRGLGTAEVVPKDFASLAKQFGKSFSDTLDLVAYLMAKGQGLHPSDKTVQALIKIGEK